MQFNVVDEATLRAAQARPEDHRDLLVRVAGYSDYFIDLDRNHQEEIISRTAQDGILGAVRDGPRRMDSRRGPSRTALDVHARFATA